MTAVVGRNILSLGLSRVLSGLILFIVYIRLATYLGPSEFGKFSLVLAYYTIFLLVVDVGISKYVIKKVSEDKTLAPIYLGNFFITEIFISLLVLGLFVLFPRFLGYDVEVSMSMLLVGVALFLGSLALPFASILQAWQKIPTVAAVNFADTILRALWFVLAMLLGKGLVFIFWAYVLVSFMEFIIYWVLTRKFILPRFEFQKGLIRRIVIFGLPFGLISGFEILIGKIDAVIQKVFLPFEQVGWYSAAYRFLDILTFIPAIVAVSLFPYLAEKGSLLDPDVEGMVNRLNRYLVALALPLGVGATLFADKIILTLFDENYLGAVLPLQILIWATVLTLIYAVPNVIMLVKQAKITTLILGGVVAVNIVLNWLLIPRWGIVASAWITVLSYFLVTIFYVFFAKKIANFTLFKHATWPAIASLVMGAGLWIVREWNIFVLALLGAVIYAAILVAVKFFKREDWGFVKSIFFAPPREEGIQGRS